MNINRESLSPGALLDLHVFRKSLPLRMRLDEVVRALGSTENQMCLDIGLDNGVMSYHLRKGGGTWHSAVTSAEKAESVESVVKENVHVFEGKVLPFRKKVFDSVVVVDVLERVEDPDFFIAECHRIIKPDGRLVICVVNRKPVTLIRLIRGILGCAREKDGLIYPGYVESELFNMLKDGFDLHSMRNFVRFHVELVDAFVQSAVYRGEQRGEEGRKRIRRIYSVASYFFFLAAQLDMLLFLTRGHSLIASAKRRAWHPRKTPVLSDGRTISEAVLSRAPR